MKMKHKTAAMAAICTITLILQLPAKGQVPRARRLSQVEETTSEQPRENVRLVLEISTTNQPTATYAIVSNGRQCQMENMADMGDGNGNSMPVTMIFRADISAAEESSYEVAYSYSLQVPVSSRQNNNYQYKNIGTSSTVTMDLGKPLELFHDPQRTVTLTLQRVDSLVQVPQVDI